MWIAFAIGSILSLVGTLSQASAMKAAGKASETIAMSQAKAMEQQAGQERASSQREALEARRQAKLVQSRARALAAAGGGDTSDPTVVNLLGDIDTEGELRALTALYQGEEKAKGLEYQAQVTKMGGIADYNVAKSKANAALVSTAGSIISQGSSLYAKYGMGGAQAYG